MCSSTQMKHFLTLFALLVTSLAFGQESCPNMYDGNGNGAVRSFWLAEAE